MINLSNFSATCSGGGRIFVVVEMKRINKKGSSCPVECVYIKYWFCASSSLWDSSSGLIPTIFVLFTSVGEISMQFVILARRLRFFGLLPVASFFRDDVFLVSIVQNRVDNQKNAPLTISLLAQLNLRQIPLSRLSTIFCVCEIGAMWRVLLVWSWIILTFLSGLLRASWKLDNRKKCYSLWVSILEIIMFSISSYETSQLRVREGFFEGRARRLTQERNQ